MNRWAYRILIAALLAAIPLTFVRSPVMARAGAIAVVCLYIWLAEIAPPFVPTLLLWASAPLLLSPLDPKFSIGSVLGWAADPVMVLFFGGFALGVGTSVYGVDRWLANFALRRAGNSLYLFLLFVLLITAFLSMWLSNIAAAALILACLRPIFQDFGKDDLIRRVVLVGVALGANLGGIATPIGTGPNAIAIASIDPRYHVSFTDWMIFALPLTIAMLGLSYVILLLRVRGDREAWAEKRKNVPAEIDVKKIAGQWKFLAIISATVLLWLSEPVHGVPSSVIAISAAAVLFLSGMLTKKDLLKIDWSTLMLIAGGITLGRLLEQSGIVAELSSAIPFSTLNTTLALFILCLVSALLSALMSNTATVVMLIPIATAIIPAPSTAILVAVAASFGMPFVISTPQNAMAYGEGGLKFTDLFSPGIILMIVGCLLVSLTGRYALNLVGIP
ncbi:MAG: SLC13 family permease [Pyrinomonadaceae bacterium]